MIITIIVIMILGSRLGFLSPKLHKKAAASIAGVREVLMLIKLMIIILIIIIIKIILIIITIIIIR